jgi:hypothetical protein
MNDSFFQYSLNNLQDNPFFCMGQVPRLVSNSSNSPGRMGAHLLLPPSSPQGHERVLQHAEDPPGTAYGSPRDGCGCNDGDHIRQRVEEKYQAEIQE